MQTQTEKRYYTPEEYLQLEEIAESKSEYRDGEILPMAGGTTNHNEIAGNFYANFKFKNKGQNYKIYIGDVKLWVPRYHLYTYPDVMVIQGAPVYQGSANTIVTNPLIILEVLSNSTKSYDRTDKFRFYRSIPDLKEYVMVEQNEYYIEQYAKNTEGQWVLTEYDSQQAILSLQSIEFQLPLIDIYEGIDFNIRQ
jgi:Uma2 family endonuclease